MLLNQECDFLALFLFLSMKKIPTNKRIHLLSHMFLTSPRGLQKKLSYLRPILTKNQTNIYFEMLNCKVNLLFNNLFVDQSTEIGFM